LLLGAGAAPGPAALATAAVLTGQLSVGWSNDWIDARRDVAVGRLDKPVVSGSVSVELLRSTALGAAMVCVVLSMATGWVPGAVHVAAVAMAWTYNLRLKDSAWSWLPYAVSFGLLPVFLVLTLPGQPLAARWVVLAAALLGTGAHVANVLPDLEDDAATGVNGLPHRLGRTRSSVLAHTVLLAAVLVTVVGPPGEPSAAALAIGGLAAVLAVAAGVVASTRTSSRVPFTLSMAVAGLCVLLLVTAGPAVVAG
ncbi:MAG TPA: UbiA family prenyltransferase, partial [Actinotalea sp.]|nr:UbiA family prenyltransferase [Actinotalea sp.]